MTAGQTPPFANKNLLHQFLRAHPNETMSGQEIVAATGISRGSLSQTIASIEKIDPRLKRPARGFYRYDLTKPPVPPPATKPVQDELPKMNGKILRLVGPASDGDLVLQADESGELYRARKL